MPRLEIASARNSRSRRIVTEGLGCERGRFGTTARVYYFGRRKHSLAGGRPGDVLAGAADGPKLVPAGADGCFAAPDAGESTKGVAGRRSGSDLRSASPGLGQSGPALERSREPDSECGAASRDGCAPRPYSGGPEGAGMDLRCS